MKRRHKTAFRLWLHRGFDFFLDSVEELVSLAVAGRLVYIQLTSSINVPLNELLVNILIISALIAISNIRYKYSLKKLRATVDNSNTVLNKKIFDPIRAENLFNVAHEPTKEFFEESKEINISGITLVKTIGKYHEILADRLIAGANIRIVMLKPNTDAIKQLGLRSWGPTRKGYYNTRIKSTHDQINVIAENIRTSEKTHGSMVIGYIPFVPSFGITMVDPKSKANGAAWVEIYHHKTDDTGPHFYIDSMRDGKWFIFFRKQFDEMWRSAEKVIMLAKKG